MILPFIQRKTTPLIKCATVSFFISYLISCSKASNRLSSKNSLMLISNPSHIFFNDTGGYRERPTPLCDFVAQRVDAAPVRLCRDLHHAHMGRCLSGSCSCREKTVEDGVSRSPIRKSGACTNACRISPFDLVNYFAIWV